MSDDLPFPHDAVPILYSFRRCPYAMRARLALASAGIRCALREVVLRDKPAALLAASPQGTVPVLVLANPGDGQTPQQPADTILVHSLDIMLWALRRHDPGQWLQPTHGSLQEMLTLIGRCDGEFKQHLDRYKYPERYPGEDAGAHRAAGSAFLAELNERLHATPYLFGAHAALADRAIAPFVRQFAHTDKDWFDTQPWPSLQAWLQAFLDSELFNLVLHRYAKWEPGAATAWFPPEQAA